MVREALLLAVIGVDGADGTHELDLLARSLQRELLVLDVDSVEPLKEDDLPEGAMGVPEFLGWLAVALGSVKVLREVLAVSRDWASRNDRAVECTIGSNKLTLPDASPEQQEAIVEAWLDDIKSSD